MASAIDVARYFISKSTPGTKESVTNLKLQKLLYYAQGFHLSLNNGEKLFEEEMQAWVHGPVVPLVYHEFKGFSFNDIYIQYNPSEINLTTPELLLLEDVWELFKFYSGKELENLTHNEEPWNNARNGLLEQMNSNNPIKLDILQDYFEREYLTD